MQDLIRAWVTPTYSPAQLSDALRAIRIPHSVQVARSGPSRVVKIGKGKPRAHITGRLKDVREGLCNFIVCCYADLPRIQAPKLPETGELREIVVYALECELEWQPFAVKPELTMLEYVDAVSAPSMISEIQTQLLKVNPYALRKSADALVMQALSGQVSMTDARTRLRHNLKTEPIAALLEKAKPLRHAVVDSYKIGAEAAADRHAVPLFEVNYVRKKCDSQMSKEGTTS